MIILTIVGFFTSLFNIGNWFFEILYKMVLWIDGLVYSLLTYAFKLFQLMCTLNFNSLYGLVSGLLTRIEALVMVFVVYKLGISLINFMLNPDEASKKGKEILINIFVTAALLLSYNTIFTLFNEISMLLIGTPENYNFVVLGQIADITETKDIGLINRLVFGTNEEMPDVGEYIAFSTASIFITDATDPQNTEPLKKELATTDGHLDFNKLPDIANQIGKKFDYFPIVGFLGAAFMIYSLVKTTIQIGVRAFKLLILQILAPIAIITIIGEGTKGKTFKNFVNKYIAVFIEVFIRMFSTLLISTFVVKFIRNLSDYFPQINTDEWYTYALMILLILVAAFKFATDIPKFIDEILSTHLSTGKEKNFIGGLLGAGMGAAAGFAGGLAGGGIGSAIAGLGSGFVGGVKAGSKGNSVSEYIKGLKDVKSNAKTSGQNIAARGGLPNVMLGGLQTATGIGNRQDKRLAALDRQSTALNEYDAALTEAVKDEKANFLADYGLGNFNGYSAGYEDVKFGDDKDAYAQKMLQYDEAYQAAEAQYANLSSTDLSSYTREVSGWSAVYEDEKRKLANGTATQADVDAAKKELDKAQQAYDDASKPIEEARRKVQDARVAAENRAKDNYDAAKAHANDGNGKYADNVNSKRANYEKVSGRKTKMVPKEIKDEKRKIANSKYEITNKSSYSRTHGQNPNKK